MKVSMRSIHPKGVVLCLLAGLLLSSCTSGSASRKTITPQDVQKRERDSAAARVREMNERLMISSLALSKSSRGDYKIGPEDLLEITVFEVEKLNKTVRVSAQGDISLPLLGVLRVKDLTANELEKKITEMLAEKYLRNPYVSVFIKEYRNQRISVIGMVEKPGVFEVTGQKTVLAMLAMAGGLKEDAGRFLFLIRSPDLNAEDLKNGEGTSQQPPLPVIIDLEKLLMTGDLTPNVPANAGDVINVPASGKVFVGGEVVKPGGFPLKLKRLTVTQAIALAEGLKFEADGSDIKIFRVSATGTEKEAIAVNYDDIVEGKADDISLEENDVLLVPKSGVKNFWAGFRDFLKLTFGVGFYRPF